VTGSCLGDVAAALVDGELDHAARERAHRHLAHCAGCRAEVDGQRRLRARLSGVEHPELPVGLTERLLRLAAQADEPPAVRPPSRPPAVPPVPSRPAGSRPGRTRPARPRRPVRRRAATGSAFVVLGVAAALALGAPQPRPATTPVDPATDAFVAEFVSTTADGSSSAVGPVPAARTAGLTTFVPLTRSALLSTGGARTTR
jgi:anti-sigma factor RsiW